MYIYKHFYAIIYYGLKIKVLLTLSLSVTTCQKQMLLFTSRLKTCLESCSSNESIKNILLNSESK